MAQLDDAETRAHDAGMKQTQQEVQLSDGGGDARHVPRDEKMEDVHIDEYAYPWESLAVGAWRMSTAWCYR